jgi:hypothetical protein
MGLVIAVLAAAPGVAMSGPIAHADAQADSAQAPDSLRAVVIEDSLGVRGTLKGEAPVYDPAHTKEILQRMGASEVGGRTPWERKKNPQVAMLCSALLPGLGQTYNGRRLKVGLMVGFTSFYFGNAWLNWKNYEGAIARRDATVPGSIAFQNENERADFFKEEARTYLWWSGAVWLIGILDSWIDAHLYDVREYTPPPETTAPRADGQRTSYITVGFDVDL